MTNSTGPDVVYLLEPMDGKNLFAFTAKAKGGLPQYRRVMEAGEALELLYVTCPLVEKGDSVDEVLRCLGDSTPEMYAPEELEAIATLLRAAQEEG